MSFTCAAGQETNPSQNSNPAEFLLMKSDKNHRNKDKVKALDSISWAIADLSFASGEASNDREFLAENLKQLSQSASARLLIKEAGEQGWRIGLSHLEHHDFHLDVPAKTIVLDNHGLDAEGFTRAPYFYHAVQASLIRALRDAWQEKRHGGFDENYTPESVLLLERIRAPKQRRNGAVEEHRVDRPGGGSTEDREGVVRALSPDFTNRHQRADLIGRTRAAPGQHQGHPAVCQDRKSVV